MLKIFIYANSYTAQTILLTADYLFNSNVVDVILLHEAKLPADVIINSRIKINYLPNIEECIECCDIVLLFLREDFLFQKNIEIILQMAHEKDKVVVKLDDVFNPSQKVERYLSFPEESLFVDHPSILNVGIGMTTQQFVVEITLNKIFNNNNIEFKQFYSPATKRTLLQLCSQIDIVNASIKQQLFDFSKNPEIIVYSGTVNNDIEDIIRNMDLIRKLKPDLTLVEVEQGYSLSDTVMNLLKFGCLSPIDLLIHSAYHYFPLYKAAVFCGNDDFDDIDRNCCINNKNLEKIVEQKIFSKMTYPGGAFQL